jgi:hypothetical protein
MKCFGLLIIWWNSFNDSPYESIFCLWMVFLKINLITVDQIIWPAFAYVWIAVWHLSLVEIDHQSQEKRVAYLPLVQCIFDLWSGLSYFYLSSENTWAQIDHISDSIAKPTCWYDIATYIQTSIFELMRLTMRYKFWWKERRVAYLWSNLPRPDGLPMKWIYRQMRFPHIQRVTVRGEIQNLKSTLPDIKLRSVQCHPCVRFFLTSTT